jgi:hypothetical protein
MFVFVCTLARQTNVSVLLGVGETNRCQSGQSLSRNKSKVRKSLRKCLRALTQQPPPPICQGQSRRPTPARTGASSQAKANIPSDSTELCKSRFRETYWESRVSLCIQAPPVQKGEPRVMHGVGVYSLYFRQKWLKKTLCAGWILKWGSLSAVIWHAVTKKLFTEISGQAPPVRNFWLTFSLNCQGGGNTSRRKGLDHVHGLNFLRNIFDQ